MAYNGLQVTILFHVFVNLPLKASPFIHNFSHTSSSGCFFATWTIRVHQIPLIMSAFLWTTSEASQEILVGIRQKSCKFGGRNPVVSIFPDLGFVSTAWLIRSTQSSKLELEKNLRSNCCRFANNTNRHIHILRSKKWTYRDSSWIYWHCC